MLLVLAIPLLSIETGTEALKQFPKGSDVRVGNELASAAARRRHRPGPDRRHLRRRDAPTAPPSPAFARELEATPGVSSVAPPGLRRRQRPDPGDPERAERVRRRRRRWSTACATASSRPAALAEVASVDVGGETARSHDVRAQISGSMWKIVLFVLALSFLVLMVMLRSLLLPLKAVLMNLLSIGAAFGVLVAIFQWGWFDSLLGFESQGALDTINVPLIFADRLRPLDGLRGLPDVADPRALPGARRQRARRRRGPLLERPHDLLGGADHDLRSSPSSSSPACPRSRSWASAARWRSPSTRPWCA